MADESLILVKNDIWPLLKKQVKPKYIEMDSLKFQLMMMVDKKLYTALDDDPLLLQQVSNVGTNHYNKIVESMREALIDAEKKAEADWTDANLSKLVNKLKTELGSLAGEATARMEKEATAVVNRWRKVKNDQNLSTFAIGFSVVVNLVGIGVQVGVLATTPFTGGVGGVAGIIGMMRSISMLAGTVLAHMKGVDSLTKKLAKDIKDLTKDFQDNNKKAKGADLAKEAFNILFFPANVMTSVNTVERQLAVLGRKMRTMEIDLHSLAKDVHEGIAACGKAGKELDRIEKEVSGNKDLVLAVKKAKAVLDDTEKGLDKTIGSVIAGNADLKERLDAFADMTAMVKELSKMRGKPLKIIESLLRFSTILTSLELSGAIKTVAEGTIGTFGGTQALAALQSGPLKNVL